MSKPNLLLRSVGCGCVLCSAVLALPASAQKSDSLRLEEVVVTAQKRSEALQEVPIAISAISAEGLERANIKTVDDLSNVISGINIQNISGYVTPIVRGVGTLVAGSATYQATATYVDGEYIARSYNNNWSLSSVNSVQVLKGPQGALFGRNATSGAIVVETKFPEPGSELEGDVTLGYAEYDEQRASLRLASGVGKKVGLSLEGSWTQNDGYWDVLKESQNAQSTHFNDRDEWTVTGKMVLKPVENVSLKLKAAHQELNYGFNHWDMVGDTEFPSASQIAQISPPLAPLGPALSAAGLNSGQIALFGIFAAPAPNGFGLLGPLTRDQVIGLASGITFSPDFGKVHENIINACELKKQGVGLFDPGKYANECPGGNFASYLSNQYSAQLDINFARFDLASFTSYRESESTSAAGVDDINPNSPGAQALFALLGTPLNLGLGFHGEFAVEDFQQEVRLASNDTWSWQWIVGASYFKEESGHHVVNGLAFGGLAENARNEWSNESVSAFAQTTFPITKQLKLTLGGRTTDDTYKLKDKIDVTDAVPETGAVAAIGNLGQLKQDESFNSYLVRLEYRAENWMTYASTSTAFKSGSPNFDGPAFGAADPEDITAYELGFKSEWLDGQLQVNGATFYYDYNKPHVTFVDSATGGTVLLNIPGAEVYGAEIDLNGILTQNVTWYLNMTALDTEYTKDTAFNNASLGLVSILDSKGKKMGGAPDFAAALGMEYRLPLAEIGEIAINPSLNYNSGVWYDPENRMGSGGTDDDAYTIVNLNISYQPTDEQWRVSIWARNLLDEEYYRGGVVANGFLPIGDFADPRQVGATFTFNF